MLGLLDLTVPSCRGEGGGWQQTLCYNSYNNYALFIASIFMNEKESFLSLDRQFTPIKGAREQDHNYDP